jgi:hypothetical protein
MYSKMIIFVCVLVADSIPTLVRQTFQVARCGCTLRVTPQTSYLPMLIYRHITS